MILPWASMSDEVLVRLPARPAPPAPPTLMLPSA